MRKVEEKKRLSEKGKDEGAIKKMWLEEVRM